MHGEDVPHGEREVRQEDERSVSRQSPGIFLRGRGGRGMAREQTQPTTTGRTGLRRPSVRGHGRAPDASHGRAVQRRVDERERVWGCCWTPCGRSFAARVFIRGAPRALAAAHFRSTWRSSLGRSVVSAPLTPHGTRCRSSQPPGRASSRPGTHQSIARRARPPRCTRPRAPSTRASPRARPRPRPPRRRRRRGDRRRGASPRPPVRSSARAAASAAAPRALPLSLPQTSSPARAPVRPSGPRCTPSSTAWAFVR